jgi:hypothetical protein
MNGYRLNLVSNALLRLIETAGHSREGGNHGSPRRSKAGCETTIWFASLGLALVGGLFATKVVSATIP